MSNTARPDTRGLDIVKTVLARFGGKTVNLLVFVIVARSLTLEEMGIYGFIFSSTLILATLLDFGVRNSLAVFVGKDAGSERAYTQAGLLLWLAAAILVVPAVLANFYLSWGALVQPHYVLSAGLLLAAMVYLRMLQGVLLGQGKLGLYNQTELASRIVLLVSCLFFLAIGQLTLVTALWTLAGSQVAAALYLAYVQRAAFRGWTSDYRPLLRALVVRGFPFMLCVLMMNASKRMSFMAVSYYASPDDAGLFFALQRLTEILTELGLAVSVVILSHNVRTEDQLEAVRNTAQFTRLCLVVFLAITAVFAISAPWSVPLVLGDHFGGETFLFEIILFGTLAGAIITLLFPNLSVVAKPQSVLLVFLPGLLVNAATLVLFLPWLGLEGAAWSLLASNLVLSFSFLFYYRRRFGVGYRAFLVPRREDFSGMVGRVTRKLGRGRK